MSSEVLYLNLTYRCNSRCQFCAADVAYHENPRFLSMEEIESLIGDRQYNDVLLSGGEPTLHPRILEIVKRCRARSQCVTVLTHGRSLKNRNFTGRLLTAGLNYFIIPLYGYDADTHDTVTESPGSFQQTWEGLKNLQSFRDQHSFFVEIKLLLTRYTAALNPRIYDLLREEVPQAFNQISICPLIYSRSTRDYANRYSGSWEQMRESFYELIRKIRSDVVCRLRLNEFPPCFFPDEDLRLFAHPQMNGTVPPRVYFYADDRSAGRIDMDAGDFVKTQKGNAFVESCRRCKYDAYCGSLITSFFSEAYLKERGESEFHPLS